MGTIVQDTEAEQLYREIIGNPKGWMESVAIQIDTIVNIWQTVSRTARQSPKVLLMLAGRPAD